MIRPWRVGRLVQDLREGRLSERDTLLYCVASAALHYLAGPALFATIDAERAAVWNVVRLALAAAGLALAFAANGGPAGRSFVTRYCCLSFPIMLRTVLIGYAAWVGVSYLAELLRPQSNPLATAGSTVVFGMLLIVAYFGALTRAMRQVAAPPTP